MIRGRPTRRGPTLAVRHRLAVEEVARQRAEGLCSSVSDRSTGSSGCGLPGQLGAGERRLVHLVGAVGEAQRADGGVRRGEREVLGEAAGAVRLDGAVDDLLDDLGGGDLDRLDLGVRAAVADGVHQPRGLEHQQPQLLDRDPRLGDPLADHALPGQRLAEGDPALDPLAHQLDRPLGQPDRAHAVVDPARAEPGLRDREAGPSSPIRLLAGTRTSSKRQLGVAAVLVVVVPEDRHRPDDREPGGVAGDQDHGLLAVPVGVRVGLAHHDEDLALGVHRPGDPPLAAVEDVLVAVADDRGLDVGGVGGGDVGLGHRERRADAARRAAGGASAPAARGCRTSPAPPCCRCPGRSS